MVEVEARTHAQQAADVGRPIILVDHKHAMAARGEFRRDIDHHAGLAHAVTTRRNGRHAQVFAVKQTTQAFGLVALEISHALPPSPADIRPDADCAWRRP